ncbi:MAG: LTA synthase family protein [Clostridia bacterium]|nr:LTA synthase family protein [Clostridia bacterium]
MTVIKNENIADKPRASGKKITGIVFAVILLLLAHYIFMLMLWILDRYDDVQFDQILYQIKSPVAGTSGGLIGSALLTVLGIGTLLSAVEIGLYLLISGRLAPHLKRFKKYVAYSATRVATFFKKRYLTVTSLMLICSVMIFVFRLGVHAFIYNAIVHTDFIENHYVDPDKTEMTFPDEKRNLIYIFLESMETTYADTSVGGKITENFIPELTELASNNVSFTGPDGKSGALSYIGTRWTAAALFAQTSGVVIKVPLNFDVYGTDGTYMPGIATLGDVLADAGYQQTILLGSDAGFAARDTYFTEHGDYKIIDVYSLIDEGKLPEDYWEWWGFEDEKLFDFAKEELLRLSATGQPFNFTTLTADTHFPDGYPCRLCPDTHEEQYANVLSCSSRQVYEFIEWCKQQSFYENTTIVLAGDHLTMDPNFLEGIDENYVRTTYNCIINSAVEPEKETGRQFATFDMFPTTLAALGVEIKGNRLGLGVNLFSGEETLTEKYGYDRLESELQKSSAFYIEQFYDDKAKSDEDE